ncbi:microcompartment protein [Gottschalkia acidurici 9a]|uniref:Microcompartment protein n=1 Tax=Gottschalkia acidurici (strain ATCC 7906 / DSM 604 / BCRC 14475 / CIP 104303 / KCTC 5404 / NCIMB 10678 / 9a) TaxID=1128398 RepID=K0B4P2_GOTA9|nr:BMC domain-containing protein [Gottschalkia acidurici]AFS79875.1 microcompartment protein [Gottschalkia acidurici 9a]
MRRAIGLVETKGLVAAIQAADTMVKSADVNIVDLDVVGSALIAVIVSGEVAAVNAAVENARETAAQLGEIIATNVIARPHEEVDKMLDIIVG